MEALAAEAAEADSGVFPQKQKCEGCASFSGADSMSLYSAPVGVATALAPSQGVAKAVVESLGVVDIKGATLNVSCRHFHRFELVRMHFRKFASLGRLRLTVDDVGDC